MEKKVYIRPMAKEKKVETQEMMAASMGVDTSDGSAVTPSDADSKQGIWEFMED
ncbi:MAG: hypothetical protein PUH24_01015 [Prevotellaceae bacterium]|nr:hypothetical protein [Prevotella sp.]MDD7256861.1 hypothetical protein [Prevotellaceae bacterium]MDY6130714.1 hypothetical protein [Prevotella sp.]